MIEDMSGNLSFNQKALQRYILHCAQNIESGGMRGKMLIILLAYLINHYNL